MAARKKAQTNRAAKKISSRSSVRSVEISIEGHDDGHLGAIIAEAFAMARNGLSGTFTVNDITATVTVTEG